MTKLPNSDWLAAVQSFVNTDESPLILSINKQNYVKEGHEGSFCLAVLAPELTDCFHVISNLGVRSPKIGK